jgi:CBS domain-containing protein
MVPDPSLAATPVSAVMTQDPRRVMPNEPVGVAARIMREQNCGLVPVVDSDDKVVGVITDRDLVMRVVCEGLRPEEARVQEVMTTRVYTARPTDDVGDVFDVMASHQVRRVPVVDQRGRLTGIVALADVARMCETPRNLGKTVELISLDHGR